MRREASRNIEKAMDASAPASLFIPDGITEGHRRFGRNVMFLNGTQKQAGKRLAAGARTGDLRQMWAKVKRIDMCAVFLIQARIHKVVEREHLLFAVEAARDPGLIGDDDRQKPCVVVAANDLRHFGHKQERFRAV